MHTQEPTTAERTRIIRELERIWRNDHEPQERRAKAKNAWEELTQERRTYGDPARLVGDSGKRKQLSRPLNERKG